MGNSDFNIYAEIEFTKNNPDLSVKFSNTSSFGHIPSKILEKSNEEEELQYRFEKCVLDEASPIVNNEEIPAVTIKNEKKAEFNPVQCKPYQENQRFIPIQIVDILASTIICKKPLLYCFIGINYRLALIAGQVVSRKVIKADKLSIGVDDGTGCISCIVDHSEEELRTDLKQLKETSMELNALKREECLAISEMDEKEFFKEMEEDTNMKNAFYSTCSRQLAENIKEDWICCPVIAEINIGDNVQIMGIVADYKDNRLIFPRYLNRNQDLESYTRNMIDAIEFKASQYLPEKISYQTVMYGPSVTVLKSNHYEITTAKLPNINIVHIWPEELCACCHQQVM